MSSIRLFAELLLNIRTATFFASLRTEHTDETRAQLSADGETITLTHEGESASIRLPTIISGGGSSILTLPASPAKELTFRLQLEEKAPGLLNFREERENVVPWPATAFSEKTGIACRECANSLLERGKINVWKDLPNENWAEMMDFWHCHKPEHDHGHAASETKGYAAANKLTATSGTGYVDLAYVLASGEDTSGIKVRRHSLYSQFA